MAVKVVGAGDGAQRIIRDGAVGWPESLIEMVKWERPLFGVRASCDYSWPSPPDDLEPLELEETERLREQFERRVTGIVLPAIASLHHAADGLVCGTGFLVTPHHVVTANHVATMLGIDDDKPAVARFLTGAVPTRAAPATWAVRILERDAEEGRDLAVLELATARPPEHVVTLASQVRDDAETVTIGVPVFHRDFTGDTRTIMDDVFGAFYGRATLAPGRVKEVLPNELRHDASTTKGFSGGPVVDLRSGEVVGLHRGGHDFAVNLATPASWIRQLVDVVASAGGSP